MNSPFLTAKEMTEKMNRIQEYIGDKIIGLIVAHFFNTCKILSDSKYKWSWLKVDH